MTFPTKNNWLYREAPSEKQFKKEGGYQLEEVVALIICVILAIIATVIFPLAPTVGARGRTNTEAGLLIR